MTEKQTTVAPCRLEQIVQRKFSSIRWTVEDWKDFYHTLKTFKHRVFKRHMKGDAMTLEKLLRMTIKGKSLVTGDDIEYPPEFRVAVQEKTDNEVRIIIHAMNHDSETLDFMVRGNELEKL